MQKKVFVTKFNKHYYKNSQQTSNRRELPQGDQVYKTKTKTKKLTADIILNGKKLEVSPLISGLRQGYISHYSILTLLES